MQTSAILIECARRLLKYLNVAPSRRPPFLVRRYRSRSDRRILETLTPQLAAPVEWRAEERVPVIENELAQLFFSTENVHKWLHYLPIYERMLAPLRKEPLRLLEIGVAGGGSLQVWRRYLHPESAIVGIDVDPACARFDDPDNGVHVRIGSQADIAFLVEVVDELGPFDAVLDDGSHMASHMIETFRFLFANGLVDGGVYLVEDVHTNYWASHRDTRLSFVDFAKGLVDIMHAHYMGVSGEQEFRHGSALRRQAITVPAMTRLIEGIEFHDSMVLVRRSDGPRRLPMTIMR